MKKFNLLKFSLAFSLLASPAVSFAQPDMPHGDPVNWYSDYVGERVLVVSPSNVARSLHHTISNDGTGGANEWGGAIPNNNSLLNKTLVKADPYEVCGPLTNGAALNGNIALVLRGNCEFGAKAFAVQSAGAIACIIVNQQDGGPVGMGAGAQGAQVTIPVIMISKEDGLALSNALASGTVTVSLSKWSTGSAHDLGFVSGGYSLWHASSIPLSQVKDASSLAKTPYKGINGGVIANFGTSAETNVKVKATVSWTPDGGSPTIIRQDSVTRATFAVGDSIISPFVNELYDLAPATTTGKYTVNYTVSMDNADDFVNDNMASYTINVTPNVYSKGRYDFATSKAANFTYWGGLTSGYMFGNLLYVSKGGYQVNSTTFAVSRTATAGNDLSSVSAPVNFFMYKWTDGTGGTQDDIIQAGELKLVGEGTKQFVSGDTTGHVFSVPLSDGSTSTPKAIVTEDNSWYLFVADVPGDGLFLGSDGELNYYPRSFFRKHATNSYNEFYSPLFPDGGASTLLSSTTNEFVMFPFEAKSDLDSARFARQKGGCVAALPLFMSVFPVNVAEPKNEASFFTVDLYPNPTSGILNVAIKLESNTEKVFYSVKDALGRTVASDVRNNIKEDNYSISTENMPAGSYYFVITANDKISVRKFSVIN